MKLLTTLRKCRWLMPPMALLLVASTSVPSLWRMSCPEMGNSRTAWVQIEACCHPHEQHEGSAVSTHCCDFSVAQADLGTLEESSGTGMAIPAVATETGALPQVLLGTIYGGVASPRSFKRPPLPTGAERSALLRVMRV